MIHAQEAHLPPAPWRRCLAVWLAVTAICWASGALCLVVAGEQDVALDRPGGFEELLVLAGAMVGLVSVAWLWFVASLTVLSAVRGGARASTCAAGAGSGSLNATGPVRRAVLAACGVALSVAVATPVQADDGAGSLAGLPYPDRAAVQLQQPDVPESRTASRTGTRAGTRAGADQPVAGTADAAEAEPAALRTARPTRHVVHRGDTLWQIAAASLPPDASAARVDSRWREIHRLNRDVVGADPHLIRPGQQLVLPIHDEGEES